MTRFDVWAPAARTLAVQVGSERAALRRGRGGWWSAELPSAGPGSDYAFVLDDGAPLPDPRSRWQPHGVHGVSRVFDARAFRWSDGAFRAPPLASAVLYELHVGTFTAEGTLLSAIERLDHLVDLGVTHVELMPVAAFPGRHGWGYDGVHLFAVHEPYGGPAALQRFVDAAHGKGLAVLLDVVYNHLGPDGAVLSRFGPYFTERYHTPWGAAVNLDGPGSDEVRRFFVDNATTWLSDFHLDGLRLDAEHAFFDRSARPFVEQLADEVGSLSALQGRPLVLTVESDRNDVRLVRPAGEGGAGLDALWNEDFHHALHAVLSGERQGYYEDFGGLAQLARVLRRGLLYDGRYSRHRRRRHGRPADGLPGRALVGFLQNHDQVGNRARGERLGALVGPARQRCGAALLLTAPFVPLLFQGEEWSASTPFLYFTDHAEPALADAVREGRRREFAACGGDPGLVPDPQDERTFAASRLAWDERQRPPHAETLAFYGALIALRRGRVELLDGRLDALVARASDEQQWITVARGPLVVAVNLASERQRVPLPPGEARLLLASEDGVALADGAVELPRDTAAIVERVEA